MSSVILIITLTICLGIVFYRMHQLDKEIRRLNEEIMKQLIENLVVDKSLTDDTAWFLPPKGVNNE